MTIVHKFILFYVFLLYTSNLFAQNLPSPKIKIDTSSKSPTIKISKWEGGVLLGGTIYTGDIELSFAESRPIFGLFLHRTLGDYWAFNTSLSQGFLSGNEAHSINTPWRVARNISFKSTITEFSLRTELHFLGVNRKIASLASGSSVMDDEKVLVFKKRQRLISPFIYVGGGLILFNTKTNFNDSPLPNPILPPERIAPDKAMKYPIIVPIVPFGGGFRIPLVNSKAFFTIEGGFRPVFSDYLDGMSISGNPKINDWYFVGDVAYSKLFGNKKDSDNDGIPDKYDLCPYLKGDTKLKGCPDRDGDGFSDDRDACPLVAGLAIYEGCPDTDGDGTIDKYDDCPTIAGLGHFRGCLSEKNIKDTTTFVAIIALDTIKRDTNVETVVNLAMSSTPSGISFLSTEPPTLPAKPKPSLIDSLPLVSSSLPLSDTTKKTSILIEEDAQMYSETQKTKPTLIKPNDTTRADTILLSKENSTITLNESKANETKVSQNNTITLNESKVNETKVSQNNTITLNESKVNETKVSQNNTITLNESKANETKVPQNSTITLNESKVNETKVPQNSTITLNESKANETKVQQNSTITLNESKANETNLSQNNTITLIPAVRSKENAFVKDDEVVQNLDTLHLVATKDTSVFNKEKIPQNVIAQNVPPQYKVEKQPQTPPNPTVAVPTVTNSTQEKQKNEQIVVHQGETTTPEKPVETDTVANAFDLVRNHYTITPVYFDTKKSIYKPESFVLLDEVAFIIIENKTYKLFIKGYTDATGSVASNQALSVNRAKACYSYLLNKGVPAKQMSYKGFGQSNPVSTNNTEEGKQLNRRVEFEIRE